MDRFEKYSAPRGPNSYRIKMDIGVPACSLETQRFPGVLQHNMTLTNYREVYARNLNESVVPFWLNHSIDRKHGGYFACLDRQGKIYDTRKYVWKQGRAVWTFSRLYNQWDKEPEYLEAARVIFDFLMKHCFDDKGRCWFSLTQEGLPVYFQRKPYSAVFVGLALIEYGKATRQQQYLDQTVDLFGGITSWIADGSLLGRPPTPGALGYYQLADLMVIALIALELYKADPRPAYKSILEECIQAVKPHYDPKHRLLMENTAPGNHHFREYPEGRLVCPGSSLEVSWILLHALEVAPDAEAEKMLLEAIDGALEFGWDKEYGGLYYFMDIEDAPRPEIEANMKLWWPHTEAIYASVLAYSRTGDEKYKQWLDRVHHYTFDTFVDQQYGEWFGYCDRQGNVTMDAKGAPYKCFFHVPRCLLFSIQEMDRMVGRGATTP